MGANPNYDDVFTTTIESRTRRLRDNITKNIAILARFSERGRIRLVSGGSKILEEMDFDDNTTYKRYSGSEALSTGISQVLTASEWAWKQIAITVEINGLEGQVQNTGPEAFIDLLTGRMENAERTMRNGIAGDMYSDGTADTGKQIDGLQQLIADDPTTGTVGGINRATVTKWRNYADVVGAGGANPAITTSNIQGLMNTAYLNTSRNTDRPDLIFADNNLYTTYLESLQPQQRFTNPNLAALGFENLRYQSADVLFDGGLGGSCPTDHMYFVNSDYLSYRPHRNRNIVPLRDRNIEDADVMRRFMVWAGNMTMSNAQLQGVLVDNGTT